MNLNDDVDLKTIAILDMQHRSPLATPAQWSALAARLSARLQHPIEALCELQTTECNESRVGEDLKAQGDAVERYEKLIESCVQRGYHRLVFLFNGTAQVDMNPLRTAIAWTKSKGLHIDVHLASSLSVSDWATLIATTICDHGRLGDSKVIVVGEGSLENSHQAYEVSNLCLELQQHCQLDVGYAFLHRYSPSFHDALASTLRESPTRVWIVPWSLSFKNLQEMFSLFTNVVPNHGNMQMEPNCMWLLSRDENTVLEPVDVLCHSSAMHLMMDRYLDALYWRSFDRYVEPGLAGDSLHKGLRELDRRIDSILPSEYRGRTDDVSPNSMGSASLRFDAKGKVAWDEIWTSFCDLALAGGPPHRGKLLEAVSASDATSDIDAYQAVVAEIRRGIEMVTSLSTIESASLGWVGVVCDDESMAVWLLRAIVVENVMVRREGNVLYLPAGPTFTIKREIKNIITSVAKTVHYWRAHLRIKGNTDFE
jgi:sirohydrochlorin cobaltochelatase